MTAAPATAQPERISRVPTLELFFDLVFVLTITQLSAHVLEHPNAISTTSPRGLLGIGRGSARLVAAAALLFAVPPAAVSGGAAILGALAIFSAFFAVEASSTPSA